MGFAAGWLLTFVAVVVGWVLFRVHSLTGAGRILVGMVGLNGIAPGSLAPMAIWGWCATLGAVALLLPNTQEVMYRYLTGITRPAEVHPSVVSLAFRRSLPWAAAVGAMLAAGLISLPQPTSFLYFNF
jgi:hypothetical protein